MAFRNLDENHDWTFGKGKNNYVTRSKEVELNLKTRLLSWKYDCFFSQLEGVDYKQYLSQPGGQALLNADIRRVIVQTPKVAELVNFDFSVVDREYRGAYTVVDTFSKTFEGRIEQLSLGA